MLPRLYVVSDRTRTRGHDLCSAIAAATAAGECLVQLREKDLPVRTLYALAREIRSVCSAAGSPVLINDRVDIALAVDAAGVHLPTASFSPADARRLLGTQRVIGVSAHSLDEARAAAAAGVDFVVFGPVFDTPSKRRYGPPLGLHCLRAVVEAVGVPVYAIGGMTPERVAGVRGTGAYGVAAIAAVLGEADPANAVRAFAQALRIASP